MFSILFILFFCSSLSPASSFAPIKRRSTFLTGVPRTSAGLGTLIPVTLLCSATGVLALSFLPSAPPSCSSICWLSVLTLPVVSTASSVLFLLFSSFLLFFAASDSLLRFLLFFSSLSLSGDLNTLDLFAGGGESPPSSASSSDDPSSLSSTWVEFFLSCSRNRFSKLLLEDRLASSSKATALLLSGPPGLRVLPETFRRGCCDV